MNFFASIRPLALLGITLVTAVATVRAEDPVFHAAGWLQYSYIGHSSEKGEGQDFTGKSLQGSGAQFTVDQIFTDRFKGTVGLGVAAGHTLNASAANVGGYAPSQIQPYIPEASFTYAIMQGQSSSLLVRGGFFPYAYNPDTKNLGLYMLRGPVYPGILLSGFETKHVLPVANMLGVQVRHQMGAFTQDLILSSETELAPFYDLSPAYIAEYRFGGLLRVGAGANFYHLIPIDGKTTRGESWTPPSTVFETPEKISFQGTKLMANASFDPKALTGDFGLLGAEDLKLYGEIALIGLDNDSIHKELYGDITERMPVMVGFNLPAFGHLEHLSLEVQWYGSRLRDDLTGYNQTSGSSPSPLPALDPEDRFTTPNVQRDNWKWSLHGARAVNSHIRLSFQVANDHLRPGIYSGDGDNNPPRRWAILTTPKDWYASTKLAFFF